MTIAEFKECIRPYTTEILHRLEMRELLASWVCMEPPFGMDEYLNCIAFECIYRTYYMNAPKKSIRWHILNNGERYDDIARLLAQRTMKRVSDNRDERLGQLYNRYGLEPEELLRQYCPICGNDQFASLDSSLDDLHDAPDNTRLKCSDCGCALTKAELIESSI